MNKKIITITSLLGISVAAFGFASIKKNAEIVKADGDYTVFKNADLGLEDYGDILTYNADGTTANIIGGDLAAKSELKLTYHNSNNNGNTSNYWVSVGGYAMYISASSTIRFSWIGSDFSRHAEISNLILKDDNGGALTAVMPNNHIFDDFVDVTLKYDLTVSTCVLEFYVEYNGVTYYPYNSSTKLTSYTFANPSGFSDYKFRIGSADGNSGKMITFKPQEPFPNEFTNNGQFSYSGTHQTLIPASKCAAQGVPSGNVGSVLRIAGISADDATYDMTFDFTPGNIKIAKIESIVFRIYVEATATGTYPEFRIKNKSGGWAYNGTGDFAGAGGLSLKSVLNQWYDMVISPDYFINSTTWADWASASDSTILGSMSAMLRVKTGTTDKYYIDSITVNVDNSVEEFTNNGQFSYTLGANSALYSASKAATEGVPAGYTGSVMKFGGGTAVVVNFDFAESQIPLALVNNIKFRVYASGSANGTYPEFRLQNPNYSARGLDMWPYINNGGAGGYSLINDLNKWFDLNVNSTTISGTKKWLNFSDVADETLLGQFLIQFRTNDTTNMLYIDSITVELKDNDNVGPVIDFDKDTIHIPANTKPLLPTTAFDAQDNRNVPVTYSWNVTPTFDGSGNITSQGTYSLTMSAEDYYHNVTQKSVTIIVDAPDTTAPVINIALTEITLPTGTVFNLDAGNYITDEYEFTYTVTYSDGTMDGLNRLLVGDHTMTIRAEDYSGNVSQKVITIHVVDNYVVPGDVTDEEKIAEDYMAVEQFCVVYLKKGTIPTSDVSNTGACLTYYIEAKGAYANLTADQQTVFLHANEFADMVLRLSAWAEANGESFVNGNFETSSNKLLKGVADNNIVIIIAIATIVINVSFVFLFIIKKRRKHQ